MVAPAPRSIQERVKPSGRVHGYRKNSGGGVLVGVSVDRSCPNTRQLTIGCAFAAVAVLGVVGANRYADRIRPRATVTLTRVQRAHRICGSAS